MTNHDTVLETYRNNKVVGANPLERVVMVYDVAIQSCGQQDLERTTRALGVLRDALNFEQQEFANRMMAIYIWCAELARKKKWDEAAALLQDLRDSWDEANRQLMAQTAQLQPRLQPATVALPGASMSYVSAAV